MFYKDERLTIEGPCTLLVPTWIIEYGFHVFHQINSDGFGISEQQEREVFGRRFDCVTMLSLCELRSTYFVLPSETAH